MTQQEFKQVVKEIENDLNKIKKTVEVEPKKAPLFVAVDRVIMLGNYCVGRMKSRNYAIRTANALNEYKPNERGV